MNNCVMSLVLQEYHCGHLLHVDDGNASVHVHAAAQHDLAGLSL